MKYWGLYTYAWKKASLNSMGQFFKWQEAEQKQDRAAKLSMPTTVVLPYAKLH